MKIGYIAHLPGALPDDGVVKKIKSQTMTWSEFGHDVKIWVSSRTPELTRSFTNLGKINTRINIYDRYYDLLFSQSDLHLDIGNWNPDIIYTRTNMLMPYHVLMPHKIKLVFEVNSDHHHFLERKETIRMKIYSFFTQKYFFKRCNAIVFMTYELSDRYSYMKKKSCVIPNGILINSNNNRPPPLNQKPKLIFISTDMSAWHGIDKIITMAIAIPEFEFHLIGGFQFDNVTNLPTNIHIHGYLNKVDYEKIIEESDVAIGTLALHRKNMNEACALKVREYLAHGLPVILANQDTDFPKGSSFLLQISNNENNIIPNLDKIKNFVYQWQGKRVPLNDISHLDYRNKEIARLNFFSEL
jgi:glycosyltransferase involved in cell wall biosynthesis